VRGILAAWLFSLAALFTSAQSLAVPAGSPSADAISHQATPSAFEVSVFDPAGAALTPTAVANGSLDARFGDFAAYKASTPHTGTIWLRLRALSSFKPSGGQLPVLLVRGGWFEQLQAYSAGSAVSEPLPHVMDLPEFGGAHHSVFVLPSDLAVGQTLYVRATTKEDGAKSLRFSVSTLSGIFNRAAAHSRMIALAVGAMTAMSLGALLIWFIMRDRLFLLYPGLFLLEALYLAYFSGEGFYWPLLAAARPAGGFSWNIPVALVGAVACLFIREIADLKHTSPRVYRIFEWFAWGFLLLALSNVLYLLDWGELVADIGNLMFVGSAIFTLVVAFMAWRRGNRAAGWFLVAWMTLETVTIATALRLLFDNAEHSEDLLYYMLPPSMVAAAILVALGVADRLREQRRALTDAERRAQTDPLTGVLNRRSLIERLDTACIRARARGLSIALLFIDLDHFKEINDSYGHAAGDACLKKIIEPIQLELRQSDVIGRYGGEEFVVILSSADMAAAHPIAERIRHRVAEVVVDGFGAPIKLTCSIGVATSDTLGVWGEHLIAQADAAVYAAKRSGRNRVQVAIVQAA
jgi:diguanylate cyclase (GGDEF)-like protein